MQLDLKRTTFTRRSTIGELSVDGDFECYTLEDAVRPVKIAGITAIPAGSYEVVVSWSQRFGRRLPLLLKVPDFDGVRIHWGNTDANTEGCILVGQTRSDDFIGKSRVAFAALDAKIEAAAKVEKIFITIVNAPATAAAEFTNVGVAATLAVAPRAPRRAKKSPAKKRTR